MGPLGNSGQVDVVQSEGVVPCKDVLYGPSLAPVPCLVDQSVASGAVTVFRILVETVLEGGDIGAYQEAVVEALYGGYVQVGCGDEAVGLVLQ